MKTKYKLTHHAEQRMQQRAIPMQMIPLLEAYGKRRHCRDGAESMQIPKKELKKLRRDLKFVLGHLDSLANVYLVVSNDKKVITAVHGN